MKKLTKKQLREKLEKDLVTYVLEHGHKTSINSIIYWNTYPICVEDVCVQGVAVINNTELVFGDWYKDNLLRRKELSDISLPWIESVFSDMQHLDENKKK